MDVTDLLRRLLRLRWAVALVVVLAVVAAAGGWASADKSRRSGAAVVIVPPKVPDVAGGGNPFINLDTALSQFAVVLAGTMGSPSVSADMHRKGDKGSFSISTTTSTNPSNAQLSPQLVFTVTGPVSADTRRTATDLIAEARTQLVALQDQAGVDPSDRASLVVVVPATAPELVTGGRLRSAGALGLGVLVLGLVLVLIIDALVQRRRRRGPDRTSGSGATEPSEPAEPSEPSEPSEPELEPEAAFDPEAELEPDPDLAAEPQPGTSTALVPAYARRDTAPASAWAGRRRRSLVAAGIARARALTERR